MLTLGTHAIVVAVIVISAVAGRGQLSAQPRLVGGAEFSSTTILTLGSANPATWNRDLSEVLDTQAAPRALTATVPPLPASVISAPDEARLADQVEAGSVLPEPGDGVLVARAMVSSRGGSRAGPGLEPAAAPDPLASTPVPSPTPASTPKKGFTIQYHKVAPGDTLLAIAERFDITPETVLWVNDVRSADLLQIDQELKILPVSGVLHTVKKGETLGGIADMYVADRAKVIEVNTIPTPDNLQEGQVLIMPGGMRRTTQISEPPAAPSTQEMASAVKYTVKPGGTLTSIADAFDVRVSSVQAANGLMDPDMLRIGMVLSIPGGSQQPAPAPKAQAAPAPAPKATSAPPPPPPAGSIGNQIADIAEQYVGYRYVWGGHSPSGFDCSGFTWFVYKRVGKNIPLHDLLGQWKAGPKVSRNDLQPGDLVLFENTYKPGLSHSGIYLGDGRFINAETETVGVQVRSLNDPYWSPRFVGGSRPR